ncbi:MAG: dipeptide ABC transporter ATP-binding protein [Betaproteobacteria bacterium]|nr:dipeptide ABC transporter ATP-binding protein [Betaproteobacteria bacterium]
MLQAEELKVALDSESGLVRAIDGLDLAIARGETFALVGESGCGKSMTAMALMRLLPENGRVTGGQVRFDGKALVDLPESRMRDVRGGSMGIIFQEPATSLNPVMRIGDQIVETIETHTALRGPAARDKALEWLTKVGIPEPQRRIDDYPFQMSGGQKQRVMIAIALAAEPELLIADEPTTALDVTIQAQILDLLRQLQRDIGMGMLLITHDLAVVSQMAHRVALMYAGQIVEVAEADAFFAQPQHPYARQLLAALPDAAKRGAPLAAIKGTVPPLTRDFAGCRFAERCVYAVERCRNEPPQLRVVQGSHAVRCHLAEQIGAQHDADAKNGTQNGASEPIHATPSAGSPLKNKAESDVLLEVSNLSVEFPIRKGLLKREVGAVRAVDGVSFSLQRGRTLALVGESGCGKTTTGKALMHLFDGVARVAGDARLGGEPLLQRQGDALRAARRRMQIIFQDPFASLNPRMRVGEILDEGMAALRPEWALPERTARMAQLLDRVGLRPEAVGRYPHEFSGGQRQRIAIARALAVEPEIIICDEPTSALDVSVQAQILNLLAELQRELGVAYLFITHNFGVVEYFADHIAVMNRGRIVEAGEASAVIGNPVDPYTRRLLSAVPRLAV